MSRPRALVFVRSVSGHQCLPLLLAILEAQSFPGIPDFRHDHHDHHVHHARVSLGYQACHVCRAGMRNKRKMAWNKTTYTR